MQQDDGPLAVLECRPSVRFSLLANLFASGPRASSWRHELPYGISTAAGHLGVLLTFVFMSVGRPTTEPAPETATYLDIPPPPAAESPRASLPPRPPVVRQGLLIPAELGQVSQPGKLAGFQELLAPAKAVGLPPVEADEQAVNPLDFQGRGVAGGVAGGQKVKEVPAPTDSTPVAMGTEPMGYATEPPALLNRAELAGTLEDLYPPLLRQAGIGGEVHVEFVVDPKGHVDPSTVRILSSPNPALDAATRAALERFRFSPGRVFLGGETRALAVWTQMTITWDLRYGGSK